MTMKSPKEEFAVEKQPTNPNREVSLEAQPPVPTPGSTLSYPEGGREAWLVVIGCFAVMFFTFGYTNAFGVYEAYYLENNLKSRSPSAISWIGSLQLLFQCSSGLISGPITDRYGPRVIVIPFSLLFTVSVMLTSVCNKYYQFILNQGFLGGISNGLAYTPAVAMVGQYFHTRRPLAMGIASSGSAIGGILFPIILNRLLNHTTLGFGWTLRVVGFLVLALCIVACLTVIPRANVPKRKGKYLLWKAWKQPSYVVQAGGLFLVYWGLFTPVFYLPAYGNAHGLDADMAIYTISVLNAGSFFGRLLSGCLAPTVGKFNLLAFSSLVSSILILCWLRITSTTSIIVFAVLYGVSSEFIIALTPTTLAALAEHPNEIGSYVGMAMGVIGLAALTGAPITGAMISRFGSYDQAMIFSGVVIFAGSILVFGARLIFEKRLVWAA